MKSHDIRPGDLVEFKDRNGDCASEQLYKEMAHDGSLQWRTRLPVTCRMALVIAVGPLPIPDLRVNLEMNTRAAWVFLNDTFAWIRTGYLERVTT